MLVSPGTLEKRFKIDPISECLVVVVYARRLNANLILWTTCLLRKWVVGLLFQCFSKKLGLH